MSTFYEDYLEKFTIILSQIHSAPLIAKATAKLTVKTLYATKRKDKELLKVSSK